MAWINHGADHPKCGFLVESTRSSLCYQSYDNVAYFNVSSFLGMIPNLNGSQHQLPQAQISQFSAQDTCFTHSALWNLSLPVPASGKSIIGSYCYYPSLTLRPSISSVLRLPDVSHIFHICLQSCFASEDGDCVDIDNVILYSNIPFLALIIFLCVWRP